LVKVQRYSNMTVSVLGLAVVGIGIAFKPYRPWLMDCGALIILGNMVPLLPVWRSQMRDLAPTMQKLQFLCAHYHVPFGLANAMYRWLWPFILTTMGLATAFLSASMILRNNHGLLHILFTIFDGLYTLGIVVFVTRIHSAQSILRKIDSVADSGKLAISPPTSAKFILLLIPRRYREHLVGDLEEEYNTIVLPEYGARKARNWYWWHVVISVGPLLWVHVRRAATIAWLWKRLR